MPTRRVDVRSRFSISPESAATGRTVFRSVIRHLQFQFRLLPGRLGRFERASPLPPIEEDLLVSIQSLVPLFEAHYIHHHRRQQCLSRAHRSVCRKEDFTHSDGTLSPGRARWLAVRLSGAMGTVLAAFSFLAPVMYERELQTEMVQTPHGPGCPANLSIVPGRGLLWRPACTAPRATQAEHHSSQVRIDPVTS